MFVFREAVRDMTSGKMLIAKVLSRCVGESRYMHVNVWVTHDACM